MRRLTVWHYLLIALVPAVIISALYVRFLQRGGADDKGRVVHGELFDDFYGDMQNIAVKGHGTVKEDQWESASFERFKKEYGRSTTKEWLGVIFEFPTADSTEVQELVEKVVEKGLSEYVAKRGAQPKPTQELWPGKYAQFFEFYYTFPDGTTGVVVGDVDVDTDSSTSRFFVHLAEG